MDPITIGILSFPVLFIIIAMGMPIGFTMGLVGFFGFAAISGFSAALGQLAIIPYGAVASYTLSVLPLFILMGELAALAGIGSDAFDAAHKWIGHLRGGLAMAVIGACTVFAACVGSSSAGSTVMVYVAYPEMKRFKYDDRLSLGAIAAGGTLGILIPPSTPFIIYSLFADESVGKLFMAGIIPGLILSTLFMIVISLQSYLNPAMGPAMAPSSWRSRFGSLKRAGPAALLILLILGGIWGGFFTPTEAGGIGAAGAFLLALFSGKVTGKKLLFHLANSVKTSAMIFTILIGALIFSYFLTSTNLPFLLAKFVKGLSISPVAIIVLILLVYLILGCLMDTFAMIILTLPIFIPIVKGLGFSPIWFGVLVTVMTELAVLTPPIGMNVFIVSGMVPEVPMYSIFRGIVPFVLAQIILVALLVAFPNIALFLPNAMGR
jgi:tripartite ATP-independent transporter DctM subunit